MENLCQENDCNHSSPPITSADENIAVKTRSVAAGVLAVGTLKWSIRVEASADRDEGLAQVSSPRKHRRWKKKTKKKKQTNDALSISPITPVRPPIGVSTSVHSMTRPSSEHPTVPTHRQNILHMPSEGEDFRSAWVVSVFFFIVGIQCIKALY